MQINPFLTFDGTCGEAMTFYQSVLGGDLTLMHYADVPAGEDIPDGIGDRVAHAMLTVANLRLQASDTTGQEPYDGHKGFTLQIEPADVETGQALFDRIAEGGSVAMPFAPTFWAKGFGVCTDRFGVGWMVNVEQTAQT